MAKYRIVYDRNACIGAAACVASKPDSWKLDDENKAVLNGSTEKDGKFELEFEEPELQKHLEAARACPTNAIHIINTETGEELV
ncbi:ferredoxin [Candidatus Woesearchaeota archaeon]|nr:ferredoxin [Candidatus Woesearchaeota archaeon]